MAQDELACSSNENVFKFSTTNNKSDFLKGDRIRKQTYSLKLLNRHCRSLSHQRFRTSVTSSYTCPLSFILLSFVFFSICEFFLVTANESNSNTVMELRPLIGSNNHNSRSNNYEAVNSQSSLTALRKAYTNQFAVRIIGGDMMEASKLAAKHGFINLGQVCSFFLKFYKNLKNSISDSLTYIGLHGDSKQSL